MSERNPKNCYFCDNELTQQDIKAYLAEQGLVAVYKTDVEHVAVCYKALTEVPRYKRIAESLIKAAGEG